MDAATLKKMNIKDLKEEAKKHPNIAKPTEMNRQELLDALGKAYGIEELQRKTKKRKILSIRELKKKIKGVRQEKNSKELDRKKTEIMRKNIRKLKLLTRKIAKGLS